MNDLSKVFKLIILLLFISCAANAQSLHRVFTFATGDEYQRQTILTSSTIIQRGKQRLDVTSSSSVHKTYKVTRASDSDYDFTVTIDKIQNTVDALGLQIIFDSTKPIDSTSRIIRGLKYMIGKSSIVQIDKNGIIISGTNPSSRLANDTLLTFSGIQPESFIKGSQFDLVADFTTSSKLKIGYAWADSVNYPDQKMISNFQIDNITEEQTVIKFKSSVIGKYINSNTNGSYTVDNKSGLVLEKKIESIIRGYQVLNNITFATVRRVSLTENCQKAN